MSREAAEYTIRQFDRTAAMQVISADDIEHYLRGRLQACVQFKTAEGAFKNIGLSRQRPKQEFPVLRRMLNVAVRKKLSPASQCAGVEFPVQPHYVS